MLCVCVCVCVLARRNSRKWIGSEWVASGWSEGRGCGRGGTEAGADEKSWNGAEG